jgi:hypothetical protein
LTSGISIKSSAVAAAGSVPEPRESLLGAIHCHWGQAPASQRCMAVSHSCSPDSGHLSASFLVFPSPMKNPDCSSPLHSPD